MEFKPFSKKQMTALTFWHAESPYNSCDALICDGAVRSGKSLCLFLSFIFWSFYRFSGADFALCGKTVTSLRRNLITPMCETLRKLGFECKETLSRGILEISRDGIQNRYYLFGGKDESSAALIQGMTLSGVLFDEVVLMPRSFVEQALARCSVEGSKFFFNCNPSSPSHWFYKEWIKGKKAKNALYLHFTMAENPSLSNSMRSRYASLYSGVFYERYVLGKWVASEGLVYPFFKDDMLCDVPRNCEKYYVSCDYGTVNPSSFGLWGLCDGVWYRIDEYYYSSRKEGAQKTDEEYYAALEKLTDGRSISAVICDPSAASFITLIRKHGKFRCIAAKNDVLDGIRRVSDALRGGKIKICRGCLDAAREFSLYRWDTSAVRDTPVKENDHAMDDIRYFVSTVLYGNEQSVFAVAARR
ncbi:MAG: PBSX family phage terminase large subunit [Clostridia bacterium]|nr:PBSX family phage terminase large subunit [Clostridia bacterium]